MIAEITTISQFIAGMVGMAYLTAGLFFLKFWKKTHDRLFAFFAVSFGLLFVQRVLLMLTTQYNEDNIPVYTLRLLAFLILLFGIWDKNRA